MTRKDIENSIFSMRDKIINLMIRKNIDNDLIELVKQNHPDGQPVFVFEQLSEIENSVSSGLSSENLRRFIKINNGKSVYNSYQMHYVSIGLRKELPIELINIYSKLDDNINPVFEGSQMYEIFNGYYEYKLNIEDIQKYATINSKGKAVYNVNQMIEIRKAIKQDLPEDALKIIIKLKNEKPIFTAKQMERIRNYIYIKEPEIVKQINECVEEDLEFEKISSLMHSHLSPEKIRILRSFYKLGCSVDTVELLIDGSISYENLKEIKYLLQCAKQLEIDPNSLFSKELTSKDDIRNELIFLIKEKRSIDIDDALTLISRCMIYKMPPEQIDFLTNTTDMFYFDQMTDIAVGLLNGLTPDEIRTVMYENSRFICTPLSAILEDAARTKFNDISDIDKNITYNTDIFKDIDSILNSYER